MVNRRGFFGRLLGLAGAAAAPTPEAKAEPPALPVAETSTAVTFTTMTMGPENMKVWVIDLDEGGPAKPSK